VASRASQPAAGVGTFKNRTEASEADAHGLWRSLDGFVPVLGANTSWQSAA